MSDAPPLSIEAAFEHAASQGFGPNARGRVGAEVEWLVSSPTDRRRRPDPESVRALLAAKDALPRCTRLSFEPGGALELSTEPEASVREAFDALETDRTRIVRALASAGLELLGLGLDPVRLPRRVLRTERYQAMEELFDQDGRAGRWMMANTASVQVCLDTGPDEAAIAERWTLAHRLAPVLVAAFANSPLRRGEPSQWRSTRQHVWAAIDPSRSLPVGGDPREAWARYALDARVMALRGPGRWTVPRGLTFRDWIASGTLRPPTLDDLDFHLTTLFPPVRPRGSYLELRMIDSQPGRDWIVPLALAAAIFDDPHAREMAREALEALWHRASERELYRRAATVALGDEALARATKACFDAALDVQTDPALEALLERFTAAFITRSRTRADDLVTAR
ncbi:glutamate-cysteine ligase family protein [Glycomyces sp. NPDC046736]|uniref:glutamate-cysteine ligase family protein n=1 Tax=Glycomyces sp. NPDC046736 TaxID=3155615 RepID=UPI00340DA9D4